MMLAGLDAYRYYDRYRAAIEYLERYFGPRQAAYIRGQIEAGHIDRLWRLFNIMLEREIQNVGLLIDMYMLLSLLDGTGTDKYGTEFIQQ